MMKSSLYEYSNADIIMKINRSVTNTMAADADAINTNTKVIFKNFVPFTTHKQQTLHININTFKADAVFNNNDAIVNFTSNNTTDSLRVNKKITSQTGDDDKKLKKNDTTEIF